MNLMHRCTLMALAITLMTGLVLGHPKGETMNNSSATTNTDHPLPSMDSKVNE